MLDVQVRRSRALLSKRLAPLLGAAVVAIITACSNEAQLPRGYVFRADSLGVSPEVASECVRQRLGGLGIAGSSVIFEFRDRTGPGEVICFLREPLEPDREGAFLAALGRKGGLKILLVARPTDLREAGPAHNDRDGDALATERRRLSDWLNAHATRSLADYNALPVDSGGSDQVLWFSEPASDASTDGLVPCLRPRLHKKIDWEFTERDISEVRVLPRAGDGDFEATTLALDIVPRREESFRSFAEAYAGRQLAFITDGRILWTQSADSVGSTPLALSGQLHLDEDEVHHVVQSLRTPLPFSLVYVGRR